MIETITPYLTLFGVAAPLITIAGSAVAYVIKIYQEAAIRRRSQFFELMQHIDGSAPIATKVAAVYSLRDFPEHKNFIIHFCKTQRNNIAGTSAQLLIDEMDRTAAYLEGRVRPRVSN